MPRRDYYFAPIPMEMVKVIDEIFEREGRRYGMDNRQNTIRSMLGDFITLYDRCGKSLALTRKLIHDLDCGNNDDDSATSSNSSTSPRLRHKA